MAQWYRVRIETPKGNRLIVRTFKNVDAICADGLCSVTFGDVKAVLKDNKRYKWQVIAKKQGNKAQVKTGKTRFVAAFTGETRTEVFPITYIEDFDPTEMLPQWALSSDETLSPAVNPGYLPIATDKIFNLPYSYVEDVTLTAQITLHVGGVRFILRNSDLGQYMTAFNVNGELVLYRDDTVLGSAFVSTTTGQSHDLTFSAVGNQITVAVDGIELISTIDSEALPYGVLRIVSGYPGETNAEVDNLQLSFTIAQEPLHGIDVIETLLQSQLATEFLAPLSVTEADHIYHTRLIGTSGRIDAYVTNLEGSTLFSQFIAQNVSQMSLSPNGEMLALVSSRDGGTRIWVKYLYSGALVKITPEEIQGYLGCSGSNGTSNKCADGAITWSPTNEQIAFRRSGEEPDESINIIFVIDLYTRYITGHTTDYTILGIPSWRPGYSNQIAYGSLGIAGSSTSPRPHIRMLTLGQNDETILETDPAYTFTNAVWSSDGTSLAFSASYYGPPIPNVNDNESLFIKRIEPSEPRVQVLSGPLDGTRYYGKAWSTSGQYLAVQKGNSGIVITDLFGQIQTYSSGSQMGNDIIISGYAPYAWSGDIVHHRTVEKCYSVSAPSGLEIRRTPSLNVTPVRTLMSPNRVLLNARQEINDSSWLRVTAVYPGVGQSPVSPSVQGWIREGDFGTDACDDNATLNPPEQGFTDEDYYLPDLTFLTAVPTATYTPVPDCLVTLTTGANIRDLPSFQLVGNLPAGQSVRAIGKTEQPLQYNGAYYMWYLIADAQGVVLGWIADLDNLQGLGSDGCQFLTLYQIGDNGSGTPVPVTVTPSPTMLPSPRPTRGLTPVTTPTPIGTPPVSTPIPGSVKIDVENIGELPVPYANKLNLRISIKNTTGVTINDWTLKLYGISPNGTAPKFEDFELAPEVAPLRLYTEDTGIFQYDINSQRISITGNVSIAPNDTHVFTLGNGRFETRFSGEIILRYNFAYNDDSGVLDGRVKITDSAITKADFSSVKAAMFWAVFNEGSEGSYLDYKPSQIPNCYSNGWAIPNTPHSVIRIQHVDGADEKCGLSYEFEVQTMLNGMLAKERTDFGKAYTYFTAGWNGSLGNNPPKTIVVNDETKDNPSFFIGKGEGKDDDYGSNTLWMTKACWPAPKESYKSVLAENNQQEIFNWLNHYLNCMVAIWQNNPDERNLRILQMYEEFYAGADSYINRGVQALASTCYESIKLAQTGTYYRCDLSEGGYSRKFASIGGNAIVRNINNCTGDTIQQAIFNNSDVYPKLVQLLQALGSPEYGGLPGNYTMYASAVLYPVIRIDRNLAGNRIVSCSWQAFQYQRPVFDVSKDLGEAYYYPR